MPTLTAALPDDDASRSLKVRVLTSPFGDGYSQEVPDGLNAVTPSWDLNWSGRTTAQIRAIDTFLEGRAGRRFTWTDPNGNEGKWTCDAWTTRYTNPHQNSLSATFKRVYG